MKGDLLSVSEQTKPTTNFQSANMKLVECNYANA